MMPHSDHDGPLAKRPRVVAPAPSSEGSARVSAIFAPYRTVGLISAADVPFTTAARGKTTFQITTSVGRALQTYDVKRGLHLVFVTRPQTPADITATFAWKENVYAAWGEGQRGGSQGLWIFRRGKKSAELELPGDLREPIKQILVYGSWILGCASTRVEVWKTATLEHYTTLFTMAAAKKGDNELTGGLTTMPTYLNKVFLGRKDGWIEIWNVSTGKLIHTIVPPSPDFGSVTCLEPSTALSLLAIAYASGPLVLHNVLSDRPILTLDAGTPDAPVRNISFRTDKMGAGHDGRKDGVMATSTAASGDVTFWDLNKGGRVIGVLRSAHNPPADDTKSSSRGGISKIEFLAGQPVIVTGGQDNSLKTWIFDETPFSPVPRILHGRSGHAGPVSCLQFLPTDFDGPDAGNKWLISGGEDRSLWGWSLRRDGQSTELSQGSVRKKAKKVGILAAGALVHGPRTTLEDLKCPEITCIATSLNRDGGIGAMPGKQAIWQKSVDRSKRQDAEISGKTGWESVVTAHKNDPYARTWFWGRKRAGRWAFRSGDGTNVSTVAISPCGSFALVGSVGGAVDMHNLQSGMHRQRFPSKLTPAQARQLKIQQLKQGDSPVPTRGGSMFPPGTGRHTKAITGIVVDSLNKIVISCSLDGKVKFWDFLTGSLQAQIDWAPMSAVTGCRYHAANDLIAFSCDDNAIRVVDMETKKTIREFWGCTGKINDFCFSNDGRWIIAASQDGIIRVWDMPTSHLVDAIRLEKPCTNLAMSATGEYFAAAIEGELGVTIWTNKALYKHVPTRQISEKEISHVAVPSTSGEGAQGLLEGAFEDVAATEDGTVVAPSIEQLSAEMMTLSLVPKSRWQTLLHLDLIKQRNKPLEPPKAPEKAPFFLPSLNSASKNRLLGDALPTTTETEAVKSRITTLDRAGRMTEFSSRLREGAVTGNFDAFIDHLKSLPPSAADLEIRSLSYDEMDDDMTSDLLHFIHALTSRLAARRDYELTQAWMAVFLRLHFDDVLSSQPLKEALQVWRVQQEKESARLDHLVGYCSGVVGFLRNPRT